MRATLIPLPDFLDAAIRAGEVTTARYLGIVVVLDRKAERHSRLLEDLVREGSSINDVTRMDLLVALPGRQEDQRAGVEQWVLDPRKSWDGVGAPGLLLAGFDDDEAIPWRGRLWEFVKDEVERCRSDEDQERILRAVDQSASSVCDYLGLSEDYIPSLVLFSLVDRRVFVFRYGGDADDSPYQLFKSIAAHRPSDGRREWLTGAVMDVARDSGLAEGPAPELAPSSLAGWEATCYLPRRTDVLAQAHLPSDDQDSHEVIGMKRHLALGGKWLAGAGGITALGYLATTESMGGKHPVWPYWLFGAMVIAGLVLYFACQERTRKQQPSDT